MYSILLVDDEPLILSGIKHLLDWEKNDCRIIDTAYNGQEALNKIKTLHPNIVLCDISMPVMNGIDLLQIASKDYPATVFVMLTNLQDFSLAQDAIHFRAVDYIVKSQLETAVLEACLTNAKAEWNSRNPLTPSNYVETQETALRELLLRETFFRHYSSTTIPKLAESLQQDPSFQSYGVLALFLDYGSEVNNTNELFIWEKDLIHTLAQKHFSAFSLLEPESESPTILLHWSLMDSGDSYKRILRQFHKKLCSSSANITKISIHMLATDCFHSLQSLSECRTQLFSLMDCHYNTEELLLFPEDAPLATYQSLGMSGIASYLGESLREKSLTRAQTILDKIMTRMLEIPHKRSNAIWLCSELYTTARETLHKASTSTVSNSFFAHSEMLKQLEQLYTRSQIIEWLKKLKVAVIELLESTSSDKNNFVELAKQYVESHIEEHISLADAADYVNLSPAYLSSIFKKICGQSFVDYINACKIEYACRLIQENKYLIYEISYQLGFNNAYYFTKIFKRYTGLTPAEYQAKWSK